MFAGVQLVLKINFIRFEIFPVLCLKVVIKENLNMILSLCPRRHKRFKLILISLAVPKLKYL